MPPAKSLGRISEAYLEEKRDLVRKSSDGRLGAVKFENARAADLIACRDAVRLDLIDEERLLFARGLREMGTVSEMDGRMESSGMMMAWRGCSRHSIVGGDERASLSLRSRRELRLRLVGVTGELNEGDARSSSAWREGVEE
jgi:hypothetical protein